MRCDLKLHGTFVNKISYIEYCWYSHFPHEIIFNGMYLVCAMKVFLIVFVKTSIAAVALQFYMNSNAYCILKRI